MENATKKIRKEINYNYLLFIAKMLAQQTVVCVLCVLVFSMLGLTLVDPVMTWLIVMAATLTGAAVGWCIGTWQSYHR